MSDEPVTNINWGDVHDEKGNHTGREVQMIHFPNGEMRKLDSGVWVLSIDGIPVATF